MQLHTDLNASASSSPPAPSSSSASTRYSSLLSSLTGLVCASLNTVTASQSSHPRLLFPLADNCTAFYSTLPREAVCTENLTPFLKLLPCRNQRGLAALLHSTRALRSRYHSLQIRFVPAASDSVALLFDVLSVVDAKEDGSWDVQSLFDESGISSCGVASHSQVWLHLQPWLVRRSGGSDSLLQQLQQQKGAERLTVTPQHTAAYRGGSGEAAEDLFLLFDLHSSPQPLRLSLRHPSAHPRSLFVPPHTSFISRPAVLSHRYLTGTDSYMGELRTEIRNDGNYSQTILLYDSIPYASQRPASQQQACCSMLTAAVSAFALQLVRAAVLPHAEDRSERRRAES